jgi:hypothetical protein
MTTTDPSTSDSPYTTFVIRLLRDEAGEESAIVELVRTGEKQRVYGLAAIGEAIADMAHRDRDVSDPDPGSPYVA